MMLPMFCPPHILNLFKRNPIINDGPTFRLHYQFTAAVFLFSCLMVSSRQLFGDPISCIVDGVPVQPFETYCWITSTFIMPFLGSPLGHLGVGPYSPSSTPAEEVRYQKYYQWVIFVLFLEFVLFTLPKNLWDYVENGSVEMLVQELHDPALEESKKSFQLDRIVKFWELKAYSNRNLFFFYVFCQLFNLFNAVSQLFFLNFFLGGEFLNFGLDIFQLSESDSFIRTDSLAITFPKVTKCTFHNYGPSGTVQHIDGLCILSLNALNEKIFIGVWFWLVFLAGCSFLAVLRYFVQMFWCCSDFSLGDRFVLQLLEKNLDSMTFDRLKECLRKHQGLRKHSYMPVVQGEQETAV